MARMFDEFLDEDAIIAKGRGGFRLRPRKAVFYFPARIGDAHPLAAAAGRGFEHDRIADFLGDFGRRRRIFDGAEKARQGRNAGGARKLFCGNLVAHHRKSAAVRADEGQSGLLKRIGEGRALRKKSIARMHCFGIGLLAGLDDFLDGKIRFGRGRRADADRLIRHADERRISIRLRIGGDAGNAHPMRRLEDAAGDFAAIGDEDFLEHGRLRSKVGTASTQAETPRP